MFEQKSPPEAGIKTDSDCCITEIDCASYVYVTSTTPERGLKHNKYTYPHAHSNRL